MSVEDILKKRKNERVKIRKKAQLGLYLNPNMPFSYNGYRNYVYTAVRGVGKSVLSVEAVIILKRKYGYKNVKAFYFRLTDLSIKAMLANHASKAIDPYLVHKYNLEITCKNNIVYDHGEPLLEFYPLVSAANVGKGVNLYDCDFLNPKKYEETGEKHFVVTIWDEFMQDDDVGKKTIGDPVKQYRIYREAILRDAQELPYDCCYHFLLANNVSECANVTGQLWNYIPNPNVHRIVKLTRKHTIFWNVPITEAYIDKRKKSLNSDIMDYKNDPNYAIVERDLSMIKPKKLRIHKVTMLLKFSKQKGDWFCLYDGKYLRQYHGETVKPTKMVGMKRHIDEVFQTELVKNIFDMYDARAYHYCDIITMATFSARMKELKAK